MHDPGAVVHSFLRRGDEIVDRRAACPCRVNERSLVED